jgi:hypothetical protein
LSEAIRISRRHEQGGTDATGTDRTSADCCEAAKAVGNDPYRLALCGNHLAHTSRPVGKTGLFPVGLLNPPGIGEGIFKPGLPMAWTTVVQTRDDQDGLHGLADQVRVSFQMVVAQARV